MTTRLDTLSTMGDRTQTQFDSTAEVKRQIKLLMIHENITSQAVLFLSLLDVTYGNAYPDLRKAIQEQFKPKALDTNALRKLLGMPPI